MDADAPSKFWNWCKICALITDYFLELFFIFSDILVMSRNLTLIISFKILDHKTFSFFSKISMPINAGYIQREDLTQCQCVGEIDCTFFGKKRKGNPCFHLFLRLTCKGYPTFSLWNVSSSVMSSIMLTTVSRRTVVGGDGLLVTGRVLTDGLK